MLENKFKVSGLKPNIATGKWYANESIISCNVSEWVSKMKYVTYYMYLILFKDITYEYDDVMMKTFACPKITEDFFGKVDEVLY